MFAGRRGVVILTLAACAPLVIFAVHVLVESQAIHLKSDMALIELNVRDVGHHSVLTGVYSRFEWHHPGPAMFYVLALPYRALGSSSAAMYAGAALLNAGALVSIVVVVWKHGGRRLALWTLVLVSLYMALLSPTVLGSAWNPLILLVPFLLLALLGWSLGLGNIAVLPVIAGLGSFIVQSHIGYLGIVGIVTLFGLALAIVRRAGSRARWMRAGAITALVLVVMWLPPLIDQFSHDGGNLGEVASWFSDTPRSHTASEGASITLREIGALPARLVGATSSIADNGEGGPRESPWIFGLLTLGAAAGAALVAWRRRQSDPSVRAGLDLIALGLVLAASAPVLLARVVGPLHGFITIWASTIGVILWIGIGAVAIRLPLPRGRLLANVAIAVILVFAVGNAAAALTSTPDSGEMASPDVVRLADTIVATGDEPVVIRVGTHLSWPWMTAMLLELEKRGVAAKTVGWEFMVGPRRTVPSGTVPTVWVAEPNDAKQILAEEPNTEQIATNGTVVFIRQRPDEEP